ncbi:MAG: DnaB-like helicase C-terminal domain-containing protein [Desulfuromonadaceae bacterium]
MRIEDKIISGLIHDEEFCRKVLPFTKTEFFEERNDQFIVREVTNYFNKYNKLITRDILEIEILNRKDLNQSDAKEIPEYIKKISTEPTNNEWLMTETEKFYQKRAVYLAILDSIQIIDGEDSKRSEDAIPSLLQDALALTFDTQVGHDYTEDADARFDFYHSKEEGIPFDVELLNKITGDVGLRKRTLSAIAGRTGGGKSVAMCHVAASTLKQGKNVLYISLEMSEQRVAERIDANLMNVRMSDLRHLDRDTFNTKIDKLKAKSIGKLIIKEYPTGSAHAGHFRALIEELKAKKNFKADLIVIDYLGICASQRVKNSSANSYTVLGSVAEELRSLGQEYDVPVLTGMQINRGGVDSSDMDMTDTSDSMKVVHSLDLYLGIIRTDELDELGQVMVKQLKNRYGDPNLYKRFVIGMDASKSLLYDVEQSAQDNINDSGQSQDDGPAFDKTRSGKRVSAEKFSSFKF